MTLKNIFRRAVYSTPFIASLGAAFYTADAGPGTAAVMIASSAAGFLLYKYSDPADMLKVQYREPVQRMQNIYYMLSQRSGVQIPFQAMVAGPYIDSAYADQQSIAFGEKLFAQVTKRQATFVTAHEIGHVTDEKISDILFSRRLTTCLRMNIPLLMFPAIIMSHSQNIQSGLTFATAVAGGVLAQALLALKLSRDAEYRADRYAVALTGDLEAAVSYLKTHAYDGGVLQRLLSTHPTSAERIQALEAHFPRPA